MSGLNITIYADTYSEARHKAELQAREFFGPNAELDFCFNGAEPLVLINGQVISNKVEFTVLARFGVGDMPVVVL